MDDADKVSIARAMAILASLLQHDREQDGTQASSWIDKDTIARICDIHVQAERFRHNHLGPAYRSGTGWLLLIALYHAQTLSNRRTVTQASADAGLAYPTAIRWLGNMEKDGLVTRETDVVDSRRVWVDLTDNAVAKIEACLLSEAQLYKEALEWS